jgi:hypothetical protein
VEWMVASCVDYWGVLLIWEVDFGGLLGFCDGVTGFGILDDDAAPRCCLCLLDPGQSSTWELSFYFIFWHKEGRGRRARPFFFQFSFIFLFFYF